VNAGELARRPGEWLRGAGPESDIVISSRVRLARNLANYPFSARLSAAERADVHRRLRDVILAEEISTPEMYLELTDAGELERTLLVERHLISREHSDGGGRRGVAVGEGEVVSVMVNEEDHLRIQVMKSGLQLREAWTLCDGTDDLIEAHVEYSFDKELGYLTACPTNVGTGMRASVMMHLPALVITRQIAKVFQAASKMNLAVRGLYGEGTEATGHFYQISNQSSLGRTEEQIIATIERVIPQIVRYERSARGSLMAKDRLRLEDRVWRAYGMLRYARMVTSEETLQLLSAVRMGVQLGMLVGLDEKRINALVLETQPAHLQALHGGELLPEERDRVRAEYLKSMMN
jgi:protein arginine kinase